MEVLNCLERHIFILISGLKYNNNEIKQISSLTEEGIIRSLEFETSQPFYDSTKKRTTELYLHILGVRGSEKFPEYYNKYQQAKKKPRKTKVF